MGDLVPVQRGELTQVSLADLQDRLDAREEISGVRSSTSTRKSRVEAAERAFALDPLVTLTEIQDRAHALAEVFDPSITVDSVPLSQDQVNKLSAEFYQLEQLKAQLDALEGRYKTLIFAHLDKTVSKVLGRPASQVPGEVKSSGLGPRYTFGRRGGNRESPTLNTEALREVLPEEVVAQVYVTVHHDPVPARDEVVFDEGRFGELVDDGVIDLDVVADHLTPGKWRSPSFWKTLMEGR